MRHYKARQRTDGKWDYTMRMGGIVMPIGYCSRYIEYSKEFLEQTGFTEDHPSIVRSREHKYKHHVCGHETAEEAEKCYRRYLLDHELHLMQEQKEPDTCEKCGHITFLFARVGEYDTYHLCQIHNNRETVEYLFPTPNEFWSS